MTATRTQNKGGRPRGSVKPEMIAAIEAVEGGMTAYRARVEFGVSHAGLMTALKNAGVSVAKNRKVKKDKK